MTISKKILAFSFAELLLTMSLMGFIGLLAMRSAKPSEMRMRHVVSNLFYNLDAALYNGSADGCNPFSDIGQANCNTAQGELGANVLCAALASYLNTSEKIVEAGERSEGGLVIPHFRRGYFKRLRSDFYKNKKGQIVFVHETIVNGVAKTLEEK